MTVTELIAWLQTQPQDAEVVIHDMDTGWFLPIAPGPKPNEDEDDLPLDKVIVHGDA